MLMTYMEPKYQNYSLTANPGHLRISLGTDTLSSKGNPSYVCRRQLAFDFTAETKLTFEPKTENEKAGIAIYQSQSYNYQLLTGASGDHTTVSLVRTKKDTVETIATTLLDERSPVITLRIIQQEQDLSFLYQSNDGIWHTLADHVDARILSTDVAGGFVGNTIGLYATSDGVKSTTYADFDYLLYK